MSISVTKIVKKVFLFPSKYKKYSIATIISMLLYTSCATYTPKYRKETSTSEIKNTTIAHSFYLIGDAGNAAMGKSTSALKALKKVLDTAQHQNSHLLFLGDNIYPKGMPKKGAPNRKLAEHRIDVQIDAVKGYKGNTIFIPGNHDWYIDGVKGVEREAKYIQKQVPTKHSFSPTKGCPIESITVTDKIQLLVLDTQWYLADWDKTPTINDECEIKTRLQFFQEIEGELKKHGEKTIVIAMHHPLYTNGPHGGKFSLRQHLFPSKNKIPLPILGSLVAQVRGQGGVSPQDISNQQFMRFKKRITTMAKAVEKVVFVSGHEHSLQYLEANGIRQIISGSGSNISPAGLGKYGLFAYPDQGFSVLDVYTDGSSGVRFFGVKEDEIVQVYQTTVHNTKKETVLLPMPDAFDTEILCAAYAKKATEKSGLYTALWGDHYRELYGVPIRAKVVTLDTLLGGVTIDRKGGGQQTRSLRLIDTMGKRYSLRAVQKSATQFLQKGAFRNTFLDDGFDDTYTEQLLLDFYTASHPYATFAVGPLADAIGVYHANPKLYYIPKHEALGQYNDHFGNELYILEERPGKEFRKEKSFGEPDDIESTADMLQNLRKSERYQMDEASLIRARLFDMLLGDWDRHPDQWRWARFDMEKQKIYRPIPRDRDQVFSNYDGGLLNSIRLIIPLTRKFQVYDDNVKNVRWLNESGIKIDKALLQQSTKEVWIAEAEHIKSTLTDENIDAAFAQLPLEIQNESSAKIKKYLKARRDAVVAIAERYYNYLAKHITIRGTDKKDFFEIIRKENVTQVKISRIKKGKVQIPYYDRIIKGDETKEIWIYGLDDDDRFEESGSGRQAIKIRVIGGQNNDQYHIENGKKIHIYDHKTKVNTFEKTGKSSVTCSDQYDQNLYDYTKYIDKTNTITPLVGFNPDDGINFNVTNVFTTRGFHQNPYQSKHKVRGAYYVATQGYDISYTGEFINAIRNWNLKVGGIVTSENFAQNFFGFGNNTLNFDDVLGMDYNRVKISTRVARVGLSKKRFNGDEIQLSTTFETHRVEDTANRFVTGIGEEIDFFKRKFFIGIDGRYHFESSDNSVNPTQGMLFTIDAGVKSNIDDRQRTFGYLNTKLGFHNALTHNRKLVLKTTAIAKFILGDGFEFYQGTTLGGVEGLRGYRTERFIGDRAVALSADLRYSFNRIKTGLLPLQFGIFGGGDVGRVWYDNEDSDIWHSDVGGGLWINAVDAIMGQLGIFVGDEGPRFTFGFGVNM